MSDYLGPNQTRVLDSENRNFESVVYQKRKPPLSSEVNLTGKVDADRGQLTMKYLIPSGWSQVSGIYDDYDASLYETGAVLCNSLLPANSFKLVALDKGQDAQRNVAWVNGWRVLIQGSNSSDENNIINLSVTPPIGDDHKASFVFLEVWRKLISPSDTVFKYGNFLGTGIANDLVDTAIGIETSLRIQIQYRIRVASSDLETYPDGFDPNQVFVQGPLDEPIDTCSDAYFSPVPGDPGLWIAGDGSPTAQAALDTVDGHTYAIPMFAVKRRNAGAYNVETRSNGSARSLSDYLSGKASDRPDDCYNDLVVADDILDMRHRVVQQENVKELCEDAFKMLINNRLPGRLTKITEGEDSLNVYVTQPDAISGQDLAGSTTIGEGDGIRRVFANAQLSQPESIKKFTTLSPWAADTTLSVSLTGYPAGSAIASLDQVYYNLGVISPSYYNVLTSLPSSTLNVVIKSGSGVIGTTNPIGFEYTINYPHGPNGLSRVPVEFLEARKEGSNLSIAMSDGDIRVRDMGPVVINSDSTQYNMLSNRGGRITEPYDFGHQMIYHVAGTGSQTYTVPMDASGYNILGLANIQIDGTNYSGAAPTISRNIYTSMYTVTLNSPVAAGKDIKNYLYTDAKFFEGNKQGRGIIDCWEMKELDAVGSGTTYFIDATNKAILSLASFATDNGAGYAYTGSGTMTPLTTSNPFVTDSTKTYGRIDFASVPTLPIKVPVLLHSAVETNEGYNFFYKTLPYQGLLDSSAITGVIEAMGPAITTTAGSGTIINVNNTGTANFYDASTVIGTNGTTWVGDVQPGYFIRSNNYPTKEYLITDVIDDETLVVDHPTDIGILNSEPYTIFARDQSEILARNIIDNLPTYLSTNDSSGLNGDLTSSIAEYYPTLETRVTSTVQDIMALPPDTVWVGQYDAPFGRGRCAVHIDSSSLAPLGKGNLGLNFQKLDISTYAYKKTYQSYIINKENSGRLYLMVVGSETENVYNVCKLNHKSNLDSVDIFELPGRPLVMRRIA